MSAKETQTTAYWNQSPDDVLNYYETSVQNGLTDEQIKEQKSAYGINKLNIQDSASKWTLFIRQFKSPLIFILILAVFATLFLKEWFDASIISLAIFINAFLGFYQENRAENAIQHLRSFITFRTRVIRNRREQEINASEVVPGDVVHLTLGSRVPADGRLLTVQNLRVDEAILTGESLPVSKHDKVLPETTALPDRSNMLFGGTLVAEGSGLMVVTAIGSQTEFGRIATLVGTTEKERTPLQKSIAALAWVITVVISLVVIGIFALGVSRGESMFEMFLISIAVAVGAIPEALPIGLTAVLAVGVERLAKQNGIMRNLTAAETLGSTTLVITDKTGTLTEAKLELVEIVTKKMLLENKGKNSHNERQRYTAEQKDVLSLALIGTDVVIENPQDEPLEWRISGSPIEATIVKNAAIHHVPVPLTAEDRAFRLIIPFNSSHKFSVSEGMMNLETTVASKKKGYAHVVVGAPDILIKRSKMSDEEQEATLQTLAEYSIEGKRMLGVAVSFVETAARTHGRLSPDDMRDLEFVGLIAFFDPVRKEVPEAVKRIEEMGVKMVIATGDLPGTAISVARDLGWDVGDDSVMTGETLSQMSDAELKDVISTIKIFARVTPEDKLRIAKLFQSKKEIVAMTGDGVNDAPSLKVVDIGIAVGSGSDVAKGVADLILLDDNFNTIVSAIEEGKRVLWNIRKTFVYLMSNSLDEVVLISGSLIAGLALPLTAIQIIWVNFFTGSIPAIAFAFDTDNDEASQANSRHIISTQVKYITIVIGVVISLLLFFLYYLLSQFSFEFDEIRTFIFVCFSSYSLFIAYSFRNLNKSILQYSLFSNWLLNVGVVIGLLLLIMTMYVPFLQGLFSTTSLGGWWLAGVVVWIVTTVLIVEVVKWFFYRKKNNL